MQAAKPQVSLHICADSPEPSLLNNTISSKFSCSLIFLTMEGAIVLESLFFFTSTVSSRTRSLNFGLSLNLPSYLVCKSSEGSGEPSLLDDAI